MPEPSEIEIVYLVAIAHVWARGTLFQAVRSGAWMRRDAESFACRAWRALFDCPLCSGFWIGVLGHLLFHVWPSAIVALGVGSLVGTGSLTVYGAIRRMKNE